MFVKIGSTLFRVGVSVPHKYSIPWAIVHSPKQTSLEAMRRCIDDMTESRRQQRDRCGSLAENSNDAFEKFKLKGGCRATAGP